MCTSNYHYHIVVIIFLFFLEILAPLKLVNYTKLDVKPAHSTSLWMEDWELTTATATCRICNHGQESRAQESWDKFALLAFLRTRQTRIQPLLPNLALTPHTMLKTTTCNFFWFPGKIVFEGRGKVTRLQKGKQRFIQASVLKPR